MVELFPRQLEVLKMIALGYTSPQIAQKLNITKRTVLAHKARGRALMEEQLDIYIPSTAAYVALAVEEKVIEISIDEFDKRG
jgi:FixJ family two-component response regulator